MKTFVDTDILGEMYENKLPENSIFVYFKQLIDSGYVNLWTSALSVMKFCKKRAAHFPEENTRDFLKFCNSYFTIIPLRSAIFSSAIEGQGRDFESRCQVASAAAFNLDCIITNAVGKYNASNIPAYSPENFKAKWESGNIKNHNSVPFLDLKAQLSQIYNEIDDRLTDIISNTGFILGKHVDEFESRFSEIQEVKHCIGVSSGTDALHIALLTLEVGSGDTVIVPVNTFIATAEAVSLAGAKPVFVDCDQFYNINTQALEADLTECRNTDKPLPKAMIPVHLYGQPANMTEIMKISEEFQIPVVEDCCQAHLAGWEGKKTGSFGKFGAFSFYPGKNLGAFGEAGALVTNDEALFEKARMIRQHGEIERYNHSLVGHNYRMEAIQGAVLATKLKYLDQWTRRRRENARLYNDLLNKVDQITTPKELDGTYCVYHLYVINAEDRDGLKRFLEENKISTGLHYPVPLHLQQAYKSLGYAKGDFPEAEKVAANMLSLPMYPELSKKQIEYVCDTIMAFYD